MLIPPVVAGMSGVLLQTAGAFSLQIAQPGTPPDEEGGAAVAHSGPTAAEQPAPESRKRRVSGSTGGGGHQVKRHKLALDEMLTGPEALWEMKLGRVEEEEVGTLLDFVSLAAGVRRSFRRRSPPARLDK